MAESLQSTSEKPPIEELGLGLLIADTTSSNPITPTGQVVEIQHTDSSQNVPDGESDSPAEVMAEKIAATDEEVEWRNAIERDLCQLTIEQAEIETARERLEAADEEEEKDLGTLQRDDLHEENDGKNAESVEDENENEWGDEENEGNVGSKSRDAVAKLGRYNQSNNHRRINYPMRPDAEDCAFYMKFGSCKFGLNCKFNHPPRRKNQGEKECPYYMRTGSCKYGSNCRFHHPEPTTVVGADPPSGYGNGGSIPSQLVSSSSVSSWSSPRAFNETSSFTPVMFPPTQATSNPEWNGYQAATYPTTERSLPTPPAFAINNLPTEINFAMQHLHDMVIEEYPERPGEPECSFFLKTGDCKFKSNCKFHHPKNRFSKPRANSCALNDRGLPLRPDQPICAHYQRYGICKYGPACKYDHPSTFANLPTPFEQQPFGNSNIVGGSVDLGKRNES
ncbi:hypothetical protein DH2020_038524 [Rehmannia glutinosa]|uniref:C3H1-type domain-containing protein n=1 Tax=Rehmannia glutinosa TaxID=99300 RepID=A0ABR0UYC4_REHGL